MADIAVAIEGGLMLPAGKFFTRGRPASEGARHGTAESCETAVQRFPGRARGILKDRQSREDRSRLCLSGAWRARVGGIPHTVPTGAFSWLGAAEMHGRAAQVRLGWGAGTLAVLCKVRCRSSGSPVNQLMLFDN